ncbi:ATP-binding protein [Streptomyces violaceorubidus]
MQGERRPAIPPERSPDHESGRGLILVDALADRWGTEPFPPSGKTVWALLTQSPPRDRPFPEVTGPVG